MQSKWAGVLPQPHLDLAGGIALWRPAGPSSGSANSSWKKLFTAFAHGVRCIDIDSQDYRLQKHGGSSRLNKSTGTISFVNTLGFYQQATAAAAACGSHVTASRHQRNTLLR